MKRILQHSDRDFHCCPVRSMAVSAALAIALLGGGRLAYICARCRSFAAECENGVDDDGDGKIDWPADPGCYRRRRQRRVQLTTSTPTSAAATTPASASSATPASSSAAAEVRERHR